MPVKPLSDAPTPRSERGDDGVLCKAKAQRRLVGALTPIRRRVLEALAASSKPLGAYALAANLRTDDDAPAFPIQIYRALEFLQKNGLAHRIASRNAYVARQHADRAPAFLICRSCGSAQEVAAPAMERVVRDMGEEAEFAVTRPLIEIEGECAACRQTASASSASMSLAAAQT